MTALKRQRRTLCFLTLCRKAWDVNKQKRTEEGNINVSKKVSDPFIFLSQENNRWLSRMAVP